MKRYLLVASIESTSQVNYTVWNVMFSIITFKICYSVDWIDEPS